jgi:hypothetical protein
MYKELIDIKFQERKRQRFRFSTVLSSTSFAMTPSSKPFLGLQGASLTWAITLCSASSFLLFGLLSISAVKPLLTGVIGYDQGIMGSIISTPYFLKAIKLKVSVLGL